jgi:hypothetical protein
MVILHGKKALELGVHGSFPGWGDRCNAEAGLDFGKEFVVMTRKKENGRV